MRKVKKVEKPDAGFPKARTLLSTAVALACSGTSLVAFSEECQVTIATAAVECQVTTDQLVTVTSEGSVTRTSVGTSGGTLAYTALILGTTGASINNLGTISTVLSDEPLALPVLAGDLSGTISNEGTISANVTGSNDVTAAAIVVDGTLSGSISSSGSLESIATGEEADAGADANGIFVDELAAGASVINSGSIKAGANGGTSSAYAKGIETGLLDLGASVTNSGSVEANAVSKTDDASATGITSSSVASGASLSNTGSIEAIARSFGSEAEAYGLAAGTVDGSIANSGSIEVNAVAGTDSASAYGMSLSSVSAEGSVTNSGVISATATSLVDAWVDAYGLTMGTLDGAFTNSGEISAEGTSEYRSSTKGVELNDIGAAGRFTNSGSISAYSEGGRSEPGALGVEVSDIEGAFINSGSISALAKDESSVSVLAILSEGISGTFSNSGTILATADARVYGARAAGFKFGYLTGQFENTGVIAATVDAGIGAGGATGVELDSLGSSTDTSSFVNSEGASIIAEALATIEDAWEGVGVSALGVSASGTYAGKFINNGSVSAIAKIADKYSTADATGINWGSLGATASLSNTGSVQAMAEGKSEADAYGVDVYGIETGASLTNTGSITASASAQALWSAAEAFGLNIDYIEDGAAVSNGGTIVASANSPGKAYAVAVYLGGMADGAEFTNSGTLSAYVSGSANQRAYAIVSESNSGTIKNSGTLNGAVNIFGDFTNTGTHNLQLSNIDSYTPSIVAGVADYSNGTVAVHTEADSRLMDGDVLENVINASTLVTGAAFENISDNSLLYDFTATIDNNAVDINVSRRAINEAVSGTYKGAAGALESLYSSGTELDPELLALVESVNGAASTQELNALLAQHMPVLGAHTAFLAQRNIDAVGNIVSSEGGKGKSSGGNTLADRAWVKAVYNDGTQDASSSHAGYDVSSTVFVVGSDRDVGNDMHLGLAVAMTQAEAEYNLASNVDMDSVQLVVYADKALGEKSFLNARASYSQGENQIQGGESFDVTSYNLYAGYGRSYRMNDKVTLSPVASLSYIGVSEDDYNVGLVSVESATTDSLELAIDGGIDYTLTDRVSLSSHLGLGFDGNDKGEVDAAFSAGGPAFTTEADYGNMAVKFGVGMAYTFNDLVDVRVAYDMLSREDYQNNSISAKLNYKF